MYDKYDKYKSTFVTSTKTVQLDASRPVDP